MLPNSRLARSGGSLLDDYIDRYSDALARRRANITLRAAKIEAELAYRSRGDFLANMNHELRTPLNAIVGFATMMKDAKQYGLSEEQTSEYLDYILQSADLLLGHINTLLELAAAESGGAKLNQRSTPVLEVLEEVVSRAQPMADGADVTLSLSVDDDLPDIFIDPDKVITAISHLVENAITYCDAGGETKVIARMGRKQDNRNWVYLAVQDKGIGMTPQELDRALRIFEQVHQGLDRKYEGVGIGLPIAKSFIELNGGRFSVKSVKGSGTTVRMALPAGERTAMTDPVDSEMLTRMAG